MASFPKGHNARIILARRVTVTVTTHPQIKVTWITDPSDSLTLRGIPAIGRGVAGAIRNTNPAGLHDS